MSKNGLVGNFTHSLDSKNRVFFPAKFREELGAPIVITINLDKCLSAYSEAEWDNFVAKVESHPNTKVKKAKRLLCGCAKKVVPDGQGRVMIEKDLLQFAGIEDSVTFIGCGDYVELWAANKNPLAELTDDLLSEINDIMLELNL